MLDVRKLKILTIVIDEYIKTGEPVGSKNVASVLGMVVSSATIRNDMAVLEKLGYLEQPYTSAGRIPTYLGYRLYIEKLMTPNRLSASEKMMIDNLLLQDYVSVESVVEKATDLLTQMTGYASVLTKNTPKFSVITRVEIIPAGYRLYALLIVTSSGGVKNKICRMEFDLTREQLDIFGEFISESLYGVNIDDLSTEMIEKLTVAVGSYMLGLMPLLNGVLELTNQFSKKEINLKGEQKLLSYSGVEAKDVVKFISEKNQLFNLLSSSFDGINVVFGKENNTFAIGNSSLISSNYKLNGTSGGTLGIIGPIRLDYAKIVPYVEYFSNSLSNSLANIYKEEHKEDYNGKEEW